MTTQLRTRSASSLLEGRDVSNTRSASNSPARRSSSWRSESPLKRRHRKQERHESSLSYADHMFYSGADPLRGSNVDPRNMTSSGDGTTAPAMKKYYIDQLTGEMKFISNNRNVPDVVCYQSSQEFACDPRRGHVDSSRLKSQPSSSSMSRPFWDQSLKTKSIKTNARTLIHRRPLDSRHSVSSNHTNTSWLPRLTKSREKSSPQYESSSSSPSRYPRGQQRPTSMASGHHALLQRHRKLVEASKRQPRDRYSYAGPGDFILDETFYNPNPLVRTPGAFSPVNHMRLLEYQNKLYRGCSQEAGMISKVAHQKCQEWLNTWVED